MRKLLHISDKHIIIYCIYIFQQVCFLGFCKATLHSFVLLVLNSVLFYASFLLRVFISVTFVSVCVSLFPLAFIPYCKRWSANSVHFSIIAQSIVIIRDVYDPYVCFLRHHHLIIKETLSLTKHNRDFSSFCFTTSFSLLIYNSYCPSSSNSPCKFSSIAFSFLQPRVLF